MLTREAILCRAGSRDVALRDGEALPDVIELEAADVVDRLQLGDNATSAAAKGASSTGRDSIGKTSLQAAAKVGNHTEYRSWVHTPDRPAFPSQHMQLCCVQKQCDALAAQAAAVGVKRSSAGGAQDKFAMHTAGSTSSSSSNNNSLKLSAHTAAAICTPQSVQIRDCV
jgi:hypothetical protein